MSKPDNQQLAFALELAAAGFQVVPVNAADDAPLTKDATRDPETIRGWLQRWPDAKVKVTHPDLVAVFYEPASDEEREELLHRLDDFTAYGTARDGRDYSCYRARKGVHYAVHPEPGFEVRTGAVVEPVFQPGQPWDAKFEALPEAPDWLAAQGEEWAAPLDLEALSMRDPLPSTLIMLGIPVGYMALISGHGSAGKSFIELYRAVCMAAGVPFFGLPIEGGRRRVAYLSCEDPANIVHARLKWICKHLGIDLASLKGWLHVWDLVGKDSILWSPEQRRLAPAYKQLAERVLDQKIDVLVVDGITDTFGGNENVSNEVKAYVNALLDLIPRDRGALILIGHFDKRSAKAGTGTERYRGAAAWHNAARSRFELSAETELGEDDDGAPQMTGAVILAQKKNNLGPADLVMRFVWDDEAHLFVGKVAGSAAQIAAQRDQTEQDAILRALKSAADAGVKVPAALQGPRTAFSVLSERPEFPDSLRGKTARFRRQLEVLRHIPLIAEFEYRRPNGHKALEIRLTSEGDRRIAVYGKHE